MVYQQGVDQQEVDQQEVSHDHQAHLRQYEFMGILMGCALRTHVLMPFELPMSVWRFLVGLPLRRIDLIQVSNYILLLLTIVLVTKKQNELCKSWD